MHSFVFQGLARTQQGMKEGREGENERRRRRREVQGEDCLRIELGERKQVVYIYIFIFLTLACLGPFVLVTAAPPGAMEDAFIRFVYEVGTLLMLLCKKINKMLF